MAKGLDAQQQIFASHPDDRRTLEALEEHFFLEGDWDALARVYRSRIAAPSLASELEKKGALLMRRGQILEERILDLDGACEVYWTLARLDQTNRPALRQLRGIHERRGQWDMVLQLAELEGATAMPPFERAQFESDLGRIWHRRLGDRGEAEVAYQRALAVDPDFPSALEGLSELCLEKSRTEEAARYLERLTTRLRGPERSPFWLALGRLQAGVLGNRESARSSFAAALEDDPLLTPAVEWSLLLATEAEDWESVASLLEHRFDLAAGARQRASIAVEASQIHFHHRGSAPSARVWVERASELAQDEGSVLRARADLERAEGNDEALVALLERLVQKAGPRPPQPMFVELAEIHARHTRPTAALAALDRASGGERGSDLRLLELRAICLRETGAKRELAEVLETLAEILERTGDADRDAGRELATLCHDALARIASDRERRPWQIRLGKASARLGDLEDALIEIHERQGEREPLIELLERRLRFVSAETELALRLRVARLYATDPAESTHALTHLERILERVPHHREALDLALSLSTQIEDPVRARALLDRALALPLAEEVRAECFERRGLLADDGPDQADRAVEDLRAALSLEPARATARRALREKLVPLERWPAALDCLSSEAESASGPVRQALLEKGFALAGSRLSPDAALPWLLRLRAERPDDPELWARQAALHLDAGRFEAALRALDEELSLHGDPVERLRVLLERARILEQELAAPGRAVLAYQAALDLAQDRSPILTRLDRLLQSLGRPLERAALLEERVAPLAGRSGIELRRTLAELYCTALAKPEQALIHLRANVAAVTDTPHEELQHLGVLAAALRASGRDEEWAAVAGVEIDRMAAHPELRDHTPLDYRRFLREEIARILDRVLGDPESALERIRELCDDPRLAEGGVALRIQERLHDLLRRTGRKAELSRRLARFLDDGAGTPRNWLELAQLREEAQSDWPAACSAYREAERDPELRLEGIRGRARCAERLRDDAALFQALRDELALETSLPHRERAALARRLGELSWRRLASAEDAVLAYQTALDIDPRDRESLSALIEIKQARGERADAIALYRRELALLRDDGADLKRRATIQIRLATLHRASETETELAIEAYREAEKLERLSAADERALAQLLDQADEPARFRETFGRWCDREDTTAAVADHILLATRLAEAGELVPALARAERAVAVAPEHAPAWALLGRLQQRAGARSELAVCSLERAASHALPVDESGYCVEAAAIAESLDLANAHALLLRAVRADSSAFAAHRALTHVASQLGRSADAVRHPELALELGALRNEPSETCLDLALDGLAEAHFAAGDLRADRPFLERRLTLDAGDAERVRPLWMLGSALEADGELDLAGVHQREALGLDPHSDPAHESLVRLEERAARPSAAVAPLKIWAEASRDPGLRARAALRAAEHVLAAGDGVRARRHLKHATSQDPELADAWVMLCDLAADQEGEIELRRLCERALASISPGAHSARISLRLARLAEIAGDRRQAATRYREAWRWDPRCSEAALCESRLARMAGDWLEADAVLTRFLEAHPDPTSASLAQVHLERGRLLSGPLEAFEDAIGAYQRALALVPGLAVARSALGGLLLNAPDRWREALALHREILATAPTTAASLHALATLAERHGRSEVAQSVRHVLAALGLASAQEQAIAGTSFGLAIQAGPPMASVDGERLRRLAHQIRDDLGRILERGPDSAPAIEAVCSLPTARIVEIEDELSAPRLSRQPAAVRKTIFLSLAGLILDPGGNGGDVRFRDPLDRAIGLWARRKVRRIAEETTLAAIEALDHEAWGHALRALAAGEFLDRERGPLRPVLLALVALDGPTIGAEELVCAELGGLVSSCEPARLLLIRITELLCQSLERDR